MKVYDDDKGTYNDAQHRSLRGFMRLVAARNDVQKWFIMADDDTWIHTDNLLTVLSQFNEEVPVLVSYVIDGAEWKPGSQHAWPAGGAGIAMSRPAAILLAANLYTGPCGFDYFNDVTVGKCAQHLNISQVHHPGFHKEDVGIQPDKYKTPSVSSVRHGAVSMHKLSDAMMRQMYSERLERLGRK